MSGERRLVVEFRIGVPTARRLVLGLVALVLVAVPLALVAGTVPSLIQFTNGGLANADDVNRNFSDIAGAVDDNANRLSVLEDAFLTTKPCPIGWNAVENGYIKLGNAGLGTTNSLRTLSVPGHRHGAGSLAVATGGAHTHGYGDYYFRDTGNDPNYATASGDDVGERVETARTTDSGGAHVHTLTGQVGNVGGANGDSAIALTGELEHVLLRLCLKAP